MENGFEGSEEISGGLLFSIGAEAVGDGSEETFGDNFLGLAEIEAELDSSSAEIEVAATMPPIDKAKSETAANPGGTFYTHTFEEKENKRNKSYKILECTIFKINGKQYVHFVLHDAYRSFRRGS